MSSDPAATKPPLLPGLEGRSEADVRMDWTRAYYDPELPAVFSTPAMIAMMEGASARAVTPSLPPGTLTVGTRIEVDHLKAIPVGAHVVALAKLVEVKGRDLIFDVEVRSGDDLIGRGRITHKIVDMARFARVAALGQKTSVPRP